MALVTIWKRESITRGNGEPYLERIIVFRCPLFGILWHKFVGSDDPCPHDHPWPFASVILKGSYLEYAPVEDAAHFRSFMLPTKYGRWSVLFRPAWWVHRVEITENPTYTLVVHGPKQRSWGFFTRSGWIHWSKYSFARHCE